MRCWKSIPIASTQAPFGAQRTFSRRTHRVHPRLRPVNQRVFWTTRTAGGDIAARSPGIIAPYEYSGRLHTDDPSDAQSGHSYGNSIPRLKEISRESQFG